MTKISVISLGCAKNLIDSEVMLAKLNNNGYELTPVESEAEIIVVNTCCFIESAKQESIDTILDVAENKKSGKLKYLVVAGCLGERYKEEILKELPEVDGVFGTGDYSDVCEILEKIKEKRDVYVKGCMNAEMNSFERIVTTPPYTAYIKIAEGCSNNCTYCIIPKIRGSFRSRPMEDILTEAEKLVENGAKELVVIAQDTSCYGVDIYKKPVLHELINKMSKIKNLEWIRVHYLYPEEFTDDLLNEFVTNDKLLNYFDIPIQHISDSVLKRMGRRTDKKSIETLISKIRKAVPDAVIRTSLIVGFPGETEEEYEELINFVREYKLERVGVFSYSPEEGTPAFKMKNFVDDDVKNERVERITEILYELSEEVCRNFVGREEKVIVEGYDPVIKMYSSRSYADSIDVDPKVFFSGEKGKYAEGSFVNVKITDYMDNDLLGEIIL